MPAYINDTKDVEEFVSALTDDCSVKYGSEFGKLLVALSVRKYEKHIIGRTAEQLYHEFGLIVAQEMGCLGSTTDNLGCIQQNTPTLQKLDALCKSLSMNEANIVVNFIETDEHVEIKIRERISAFDPPV